MADGLGLAVAEQLLTLPGVCVAAMVRREVFWVYS